MPEEAAAGRTPGHATGHATARRRAGRNLPAAIAVAVALGTLVIVTLYALRVAFVAVLVLAIGVGIYEFARALRQIGADPPLVPLLAGTVAMAGLAYARGAPALLFGLLATVAACLGWRVIEAGGSDRLRDVAAAAFAAAYLPFLAGFCVLLAVPADGPRRVTAFITTVVASDVGGYAAGVLFGRHPMAPSVSPKKTWEGAAGSAVGCVLAGVANVGLSLHGRWWQGVAFGLAVVVTATIGDLGESMIKRDIGIKDMGSLLPGHGGAMDRLDSLLPTAPVAWLLLSAFVPVPR